MLGDPQTSNGPAQAKTSNFTVKAGLAQMLKGGVIMDVVNAEQVAMSCFWQ
jgi:pyridoxal 5'-phosphate synthase pdxS subunit